MSRRNLPPPFVWIAGPGERAIRARKVAEAEEEQKKREEAASLAEFWCTIKAGKAGELGSLKWANALANEEKAEERRCEGGCHGSTARGGGGRIPAMRMQVAL